MAHELDYSKGKAAIAYNIEGGTPWHKEGTVMQGRFTGEQALETAGIDFTVELQDLATSQGIVAREHKAVVRTDTNAVLGVVSNQYAVLQNREAVSFFDPLVTDNKAIFETAGALQGGKVIWLLAKLDSEPLRIVGDDVVDQYFLLTNNHMGTGAAKGRFTPIRVVCANTLGWAMGRAVRDEITVKHTGDIAKRVAFAGELLARAGKFYNEIGDGYREMAKTKLNAKQTLSYIKEALRPYKTKTNEVTGEGLELEEEVSSSRLLKEVDSVLNLVETGRGTDIKGVRGTLWGTYNAITEYVDHVKSSNSRTSATQYIGFGVGRMVKQKAVTIALDHIKNPATSVLALN